MTLKDAEGNPLLEVLFGKQRDRGGQYVRYVGQPTVYMTKDTLWLDDKNEDWLDKNLLDIPGDELMKSIKLWQGADLAQVRGLDAYMTEDESKDWLSKKWIDPQKTELLPPAFPPTVHMTRADKEADWQIDGLSPDTAVDQTELSRLGDILEDVSFYKLASYEWSEEQMGRNELAYFTAELFDGRSIHINIGTQANSDDQYHYMKLRMSLQDGVDDEALKTQVTEFNQKVQSHTYGMGSWFGEKFLKTPSDFIQKEEKEAT